VHHWQYSPEIAGIEFIIKTFTTRFKMVIKRQSWRDRVNRMDDNQFAKIANNGRLNTWTASKILMRKLDINITTVQNMIL